VEDNLGDRDHRTAALAVVVDTSEAVVVNSSNLEHVWLVVESEDSTDFLFVAAVDMPLQFVARATACIVVVLVVAGMMAVDVDLVQVDKMVGVELGRKKLLLVPEGCRLNVYRVVVPRMVQKLLGQVCECALLGDMMVAAAAAAEEGSCRMEQVHLVEDIVVLVLVVEEQNIAVAELVEDSHHRLHHSYTLVEVDDHTERVGAVTLMLLVMSRSLSSL